MRRVLGLFASLVIAVISLAFASPAQAVTLVTFADCQSALNGQTITVPSGETSFFINFTSCSVTTPASGSGVAQTNPNLILSNTANPPQPGGGNNPSDYSVSGQLQLMVSSASSPGSISGSRQGGPGAIPDGIYTVYFGYFTSAPSSYYGSFTVDVGGSGGGGSPSPTSTSAPALETLTLEVSTGGTTCTGGSPTGYTGSWLQLPAADACSQSGPNANPNAKLLGWATDPIFPVAVAQQIVDLKYGPIDDYFYGMRMIFIPAGGWTYFSSSNNLYPIWSS